jgi:hypothetical protein
VILTRKRDGQADSFVDLLRSIDKMSSDQVSILKEVRAMIKDYCVTDIQSPAGSQVVYLHADRILQPTNGDPHGLGFDQLARTDQS